MTVVKQILIGSGTASDIGAKYDDTGVISEVAIALLPFGIDVGDRLKFDNFEFTVV